MMPILDLFNKIKWDKEFGTGSFQIGYYDRVLDDLVFVSFKELHLVPGDHFSFEVTDYQGVVHSVPFHRVRKVYKDGQLIWERKVEQNNKE